MINANDSKWFSNANPKMILMWKLLNVSGTNFVYIDLKGPIFFVVWLLELMLAFLIFGDKG